MILILNLMSVLINHTSEDKDETEENGRASTPVLPNNSDHVVHDCNQKSCDDWKWEIVNNVPSQAHCISIGGKKKNILQQLGTLVKIPEKLMLWVSI